MTETLLVDSGEWYPVYWITHDESCVAEWYGPNRVELPDGFAARWDAAREEFEACQRLMSDAVEGASRKETPRSPLLDQIPIVDLSDIDPQHTWHLKHGDIVVGQDGQKMRVSLQ